VRNAVELEAMTLGRTEFEAVALRYEFFYGPGTWFMPDGDMEEQVRRQQVPIVDYGQGVWSYTLTMQPTPPSEP
jgi:hypothetical protein